MPSTLKLTQIVEGNAGEQYDAIAARYVDDILSALQPLMTWPAVAPAATAT